VLPSAIGVPTLAQFRFSGLAISSAEIQIKYAEAILSNSTRKLLRFEIIRMLVAFKKINLFASFIIQLYVYFIFRVPRGLNCPSLNDESERERTIVFAKSFLFIYLFVYFAGVADLPVVADFARRHQFHCILLQQSQAVAVHTSWTERLQSTCLFQHSRSQPSVVDAHFQSLHPSLLCNSLPSDIQSSPSLPVFRQRLKTFFFAILFLT